MAKITIKELESLTANDAGRILTGRVSVRKDGVHCPLNLTRQSHIEFTLSLIG
ncbi:hypothetical protein [Pseudomonas sp. AIG]